MCGIRGICNEIELIADHETCVQDLPAWCKVIGNELVSTETDGRTIRGVIRRTAE